MDTLLGILFIIFCVGLIKPKLVLRWDKNPTRLKVFLYWFFISMLLSFIIGTGESEEVVVEEATVEKTVMQEAIVEETVMQEAPKNPKIDLFIKLKPENVVEYKIETNIPLPIEVMVGLDATGGTDDDPAIGRTKRVLIDTSPFIYSLVATLDGLKPIQDILPSGKYDANVIFYPNWGAKNGNPAAKQIKSEVSVSKIVELETISSIEELRERMKKRWWGMDVAIYDEWDRNKFTQHMGELQELQVTNKNPEIVKVYYFVEADMTVFVSKPLNQVLIWRLGKTDKL